MKEATLLSGIEASDATLFEHDGRWWMFATVRDGGAFSDALHIWSAPELRGPWQPHRAQSGAGGHCERTSRPGASCGAMARLIRPFQDCREGYGAALGLAESPGSTTRASSSGSRPCCGPGPLWPGRRLHTLNRAGRLECIDGSATARRF